MTARKTVVYECDVCGTEVTVNSEGLGNLSPIYCCGTSLFGTEKKLSTKPAVKIASRKKPGEKATAKKTAEKSRVRKTKKAPQKKRARK